MCSGKQVDVWRCRPKARLHWDGLQLSRGSQKRTSGYARRRAFYAGRSSAFRSIYCSDEVMKSRSLTRWNFTSTATIRSMLYSSGCTSRPASAYSSGRPTWMCLEKAPVLKGRLEDVLGNEAANVVTLRAAQTKFYISRR